MVTFYIRLENHITKQKSKMKKNFNLNSKPFKFRPGISIRGQNLGEYLLPHNRKKTAQTYLSKNFQLAEFTASEISDTYKLDNTPTPEAIESLRYLCTAVLQPLRDAIDTAISVSSGYRSPEVNIKAGGVPNSQHESGEAADISANGWTIERLARKIFELGLPVDQCIVEYDQNVLHVSIKRPRFQYLTRESKDGKLQYAQFDTSTKAKRSAKKKKNS
jgi:zinc D-Ala-D-Ala carboxypeptidase